MSNSQTDAVLKFMRYHGGITSQIAFREFGVTRLSSIVCKLRKKGYVISTDIEYAKTRYGTTSGYAKYTLVSSPQIAAVAGRAAADALVGATAPRTALF